jgi:hypothetical protein
MGRAAASGTASCGTGRGLRSDSWRRKILWTIDEDHRAVAYPAINRWGDNNGAKEASTCVEISGLLLARQHLPQTYFENFFARLSK